MPCSIARPRPKKAAFKGTTAIALAPKSAKPVRKQKAASSWEPNHSSEA